MQRLVATTEGDRPQDLRDRAILLLLAVYALRSGEVRALKLEDVDWERNLLFIPRTKGRRTRALSSLPYGRRSHRPLPPGGAPSLFVSRNLLDG